MSQCKADEQEEEQKEREEVSGEEMGGIMAAGCPPMAWGVATLHADEVPHRRRRCQVLALSQSPFSCRSPRTPTAPGTLLGSVLYKPGGAFSSRPRATSHAHAACIVGLRSHSARRQHTLTQDTSKATMRSRSPPPPFTPVTHWLTNLHSDTAGRRLPSDTHLHPQWRGVAGDVLPPLCRLGSSSWRVADLPLEEVSSVTPAGLARPGWRSGGQLARSLMGHTSFMFLA